MFRSVEQKDFHDRIAAHIKNPTAPLLLEGTAGLGQTRAMVLALFKSGKRMAMVFPTHQLIDQFLASTDLAAALEHCRRSVRAFRPRKMTEETGGDYERMKLEASTADLLLCTVRRQRCWFQRPRKLGEYLAHLVDSIMRRTCGVASAGFQVFCV